jgi:hypothetical protein
MQIGVSFSHGPDTNQPGNLWSVFATPVSGGPAIVVADGMHQLVAKGVAIRLSEVLAQAKVQASIGREAQNRLDGRDEE